MRNIILKGWHYCINFIPCFVRFDTKSHHEIDKMFTFGPDCKYSINEPSCVNKLMGMCYGLTAVHKESDRFGWAYNDAKDTLTIYAYSYNKGKLNKKPIYTYFFTSADDYINLRCNLTVEMVNEKERYVHFTINGMLMDSEVYCSDDAYSWIGCTLGPYFGGNSVAPRTVKI